MPAQRRTLNRSAATRRVAGAGSDWCWCGNRAVARCTGCNALVCERHRLQDGLPPPELVHHAGNQNGWPAWPYLAEEAWHDTVVDSGWLGDSLAEQLFVGGYAARGDLARCRACRTKAGLELIAAWQSTEPPADLWDRAQWLMAQGFDPARVVSTVDVGQPALAVKRFLRATKADRAPDSLTVLWHRDRHGQAVPIARASGWSLPEAATVPASSDDGATAAHLFVTADGETYVYVGDTDASVGRVQTSERRRGIEYKRLGDDRWDPGRLALLAFTLNGSGQP